jgi:hypothetical protein
MIEIFVSNSENDQIVEKIFTLLGYSIITLFICGVLLWAYYINEKNKHFFVSMFSLFMLFYALIIISIVVINKNNYDTLTYTILFGITIFVIFLTFFISIFFLLKSFNFFSYQNVKTNIYADPYNIDNRIS